MTDSDLQRLFRSTILKGNRVPHDAELTIDRDDESTFSTRLFVGWNGPFGYQREALSVSHLVAIREEGDAPFRNDRDIEKELRRSVVHLANCCIEATSPQTVRPRQPTYR